MESPSADYALLEGSGPRPAGEPIDEPTTSDDGDALTTRFPAQKKQPFDPAHYLSRRLDV